MSASHRAELHRPAPHRAAQHHYVLCHSRWPLMSHCTALCHLRLDFEVGLRTGINVLAISVIYRVRTNPEVVVMPKGGALALGAGQTPSAQIF